MTVLQVMQSSLRGVAQIKKCHSRGYLEGQPPGIFLLDQAFIKNRKIIIFHLICIFIQNLISATACLNIYTVFLKLDYKNIKYRIFKTDYDTTCPCLNQRGETGALKGHHSPTMETFFLAESGL
jgi:hypothetical protein